MKNRIFLWGEATRFANYQRALEAGGAQAVLSTNPEDAVDCQGLLLTGGGDLDPALYGQENLCCQGVEPDRDEAEMELLDRFTVTGKPILGICRGLQVINVYFGGSLLQNICGHEATEQGDRLHGSRTDSSLLSALYGPAFTVNSAHHQAVDRIGGGLRAIQWAEDGIVEGLRHRTLPIYALQWHPERLRGRFSNPRAADGDAIFHYFLLNSR